MYSNALDNIAANSVRSSQIQPKLSISYPVIKRGLDITVATIALAALSPLMLVVALLIKIDSSGSILYSQTRVGMNGSQFKMWKFRSMRVHGAPSKRALIEAHGASDGIRFKLSNDPRVTPVGRILRKFSIDELPQLVNVLMGDMSLVGPRPALPSEVARYNSYQIQRLAAKPGLTCTWQVSGRSSIPFAQQVEMDRDYIANASFILDCVLLLKTVPAVLAARGAH